MVVVVVWHFECPLVDQEDSCLACNHVGIAAPEYRNTVVGATTISTVIVIRHHLSKPSSQTLIIHGSVL